jgi:hypothetical protein
MCGLGIIPHAVEQYRFPHTAQPNEQQTFRRTPQLHPLEGNTDRGDELVASGELGRWRPGAGREGIEDWIHRNEVSKVIEFIKIQ